MKIIYFFVFLKIKKINYFHFSLVFLGRKLILLREKNVFSAKKKQIILFLFLKKKYLFLSYFIFFY